MYKNIFKPVLNIHRVIFELIRRHDYQGIIETNKQYAKIITIFALSNVMINLIV